MLPIHEKTFNPEILYVFDTFSKGPANGVEHSHDFFELSIILSGESYYTIDKKEYYISEPTILILNPGVEHMEYTKEEMENVQMHIGLRNFQLTGFQNNYLPLQDAVIHLSKNKKKFFETCYEIIQERREINPGYKLILKALIYKLLIYILREKETEIISSALSIDEQNKIQLIKEVKTFLETRYWQDVTLDQLAKDFSTSPSILSRDFKKYTGDSPINYLINFRLNKAKDLIQADQTMSIKEVSRSVGYEDSLYFSKLFKKHYGFSPTLFIKHQETKKK